MYALSLCCHLAVFLLIAGSRQLPSFHPDEEPVTYVDMVTLPVASPQSGTPAPAAAAPPEPPAPSPTRAAMALPAPKPKANLPAKVLPAPPPQAKAQKPAPAEDAREFNERMAKLERIAEDKRQAAVLANLKNRGGRTGMPGAKGNEAGSDYASYLQSRLKDAFREVVVAQSRSPQVIATITIGTDGRVADYHVEKNSGDPLFDDAVARAVALAGKTLKPPPGGGEYKRVFRFRPEGVGIR